ncbi:serine/threonine protein kinase [Methylovulum psychrotolerans]|uniref:Stress response kinase A n=1 Tax=Methylovulum psychrotolerans TaxID=1704499 RepID=A0A1Z4C186_9GAMM|nr:serine/threonine protein kinase [Methylovulum psychrotolerans]ASF47259.1 stress response serine/threonine protein kinase YihE [Methylovulum psychrotolerans]
MTTSLAPFYALSPDIILNALESIGLTGDGRMLALNSYENRVYQVGVADAGTVVMKFYRPGRWTDAAILEEHAFVQALYEEELPVVPALAFGNGATLHELEGFRFAVFPKQGGRVPELAGAAKLERMGRLIARIHAIGAETPFRHRPGLDVAQFGVAARDFLHNNRCIPAEFAETYHTVSTECLAMAQACFERAGKPAQLRLHGDCYPGNVLWTDDGPHFVDFDDSRTGPAMQDLWMLLSGEREEMAVQLGHLLAGYRMFYDFDSRELHLLEALRTLRLIHYSAWLASRWDDPAFPTAFPWFTWPNYWQERIAELRVQLTLMAQPSLAVSRFDD